MNRLVSQQASGPMVFSGTVNEPATVTVQGQPATVKADNTWQGTASVSSGTNTVSVVATDPSGNVRTNTYEVSNTATAKTFTHDANGNLTADGTRSFEWDALDHVTAIVEGSNRTEFTYSGIGERVRIVQRESGVIVSDVRVVWCDREICEERDASGGILGRRFREGQQAAGSTRLVVGDHLRSVWALTDSSGTLRARYEYDAYGRATKVTGDLDSATGFTGHSQVASGPYWLTPWRLYDPGTGRWLSKDPIGFAGGINGYDYVDGRPLVEEDPYGLLSGSVIKVAVRVVAGAGGGAAASVIGAFWVGWEIGSLIDKHLIQPQTDPKTKPQPPQPPSGQAPKPPTGAQDQDRPQGPKGGDPKTKPNEQCYETIKCWRTKINWELRGCEYRCEDGSPWFEDSCHEIVYREKD